MAPHLGQLFFWSPGSRGRTILFASSCKASVVVQDTSNRIALSLIVLPQKVSAVAVASVDFLRQSTRVVAVGCRLILSVSDVIRYFRHSHSLIEMSVC